MTPGFDPLKMAIGPEEYFVLSRIDGNQTLREVLLATGLEVDRAIAIVTKLRSIGALLLPGEGAPPAATRPPATTKPSSLPPVEPVARRPELRGQHPTTPPATVASGPLGSPATARTSNTAGGRKLETGELELSHDLQLPNPSAAEIAALAEDVEIPERERRRILAMAR
ncbi:MAG: hypothetical protein AB7L28_27815, partial [Kofleriaceae bacterium]